MKDHSWEAKAACRQSDVQQWMADSFFAETTAGRKPAKKLCGTCPVRLECLSHALENGETWGVWGGCDEVDLRRTLWTDTNGTERARKRFPRCPACRAETKSLQLEEDSVTCTECSFTWAASTSVEAMKAYLNPDATEHEPVATAPNQPAAKVRKARKQRPLAQRSRIPSESRKRGVLVVLPGARESVPDQPVHALAASGYQSQQQRNG